MEDGKAPDEEEWCNKGVERVRGPLGSRRRFPVVEDVENCKEDFSILISWLKSFITSVRTRARGAVVVKAADDDDDDNDGDGADDDEDEDEDEDGKDDDEDPGKVASVLSAAFSVKYFPRTAEGSFRTTIDVDEEEVVVGRGIRGVECEGCI